jgi:hypothetical protein
LHEYKEWKEANETKKHGKCTWLTKELEGTCMCMESDFVGQGKQRAWLDEYKHWCCGEAQWYK